VAAAWLNATTAAGEFGASLQAGVTNGPLRYCDYQLGQTNRFYKVRIVEP